MGLSKDTLEQYAAVGSDGKAKIQKHYVKIAKAVSYDKGKKINDLGYSWLYGEQGTREVILTQDLQLRL